MKALPLPWGVLTFRAEKCNKHVRVLTVHQVASFKKVQDLG